MELNAEQIKKALECCASEKYICTQCPIDEKIKDDCECGNVVARNALALINSQEQRIKELTEEFEKERTWADSLIDNLRDDIRELAEENERLQKHNAVLIEDNHILSSECIPMAKADTVRKMQERLMEAPIKVGLPLFGLQTKDEVEDYANELILQMRDTIDQIAKEMLEGVGDAGE